MNVYTSELILCFTICVHSATRHNIHMYPYFLFAAFHHLNSSPTFSVRPRSSVGRVTVDLIRWSWVRFPLRSIYFFFTSCGSLILFTRANVQAVIHEFYKYFNLYFTVNSLFHHNIQRGQVERPQNLIFSQFEIHAFVFSFTTHPLTLHRHLPFS